LRTHLSPFLFSILVLAPAVSSAQITALVAIEPTSRKEGLMLSRTGIESSLGKLLGQTVTVTVTDDLTEAMRTTRTGSYSIFIGPAQVAASSIAHGYELIGSTDPEEQYVLIGRADVKAVGDLRKQRIYLPQQDSIYTYLARGMLTASGLSFKDMGKVEYARYPQAGLTAITLRSADATLIRQDDWDAWQKDASNAKIAKLLATSSAVPGGFSVTVKKQLDAGVRGQISKWFATSANAGGMRPVVQHAELGHYQKVAELGTFTPTSLPGAVVVGADDVKRLMAEGAVVVDTRSEKEFAAKHIPGAVFAPYHEKSLKDVVYDAALDDFSALKQLNAKTPAIFHCNGAECWKSYKASRAALAAGFTKVYWYRGGMPDWERANLQAAVTPR
jgi:rhodanese-related sulfurtransferase